MKRTIWLVGACVLGGAMVGAMVRMQRSQVQAADVAVPLANTLDVVINEVAWMGTEASSYDEWIELYNTTNQDLDLTGWTLTSSDGTPTIHLTGIISAHSYYLLERTDDSTISNIPADQIYTGDLLLGGEVLTLTSGASAIIDTANAENEGPWPAGSNNPDHTMERIDPTMPDTDDNWCTNDGIVRIGLDASSNPINGTPRAQNSCYQPPPGENADLQVSKYGPAVVSPGGLITYRISLSNTGSITASAVRVTDTLPLAVDFVAQTSPFTVTHLARAWIWTVGDVAPGTGCLITLTAKVQGTAVATLTNVVTATTITSETTHTNNSGVWTTAIGPAGEPQMLILAVLYDGYQYDDLDEAVQLTNMGAALADLSGWYLADDATDASGAAFPDGVTLPPHDSIWCARNAMAFAEEFGFKPDFETDTVDPAVAELIGSWPGFANAGDECALFGRSGQLIDVLVYGDSAGQTGWHGAALQPWAPTATFAREGQILYRKLDQITGQPVPDTNTAADWAQDPEDHINGRKVQYPGWDLAEFFQTGKVTETADLQVAVAPDNAYEVIKSHIESATTSILIEGYTFENAHLIDAVVSRAQAGVAVRVLLEGGEVTDQQRWFCQRIHAAGSEAYFLHSDDDQDIHARYRSQHAKFVIIDSTKLIVGSENFNYSGLPVDDKANGTWGRRGTFLITDAPTVVSRAQAIFDRDLDTAHRDIVPWHTDDPRYGTPTPGFTPTYIYSDWVTYTVRFSQPLTLKDAPLTFEVVQSPENSLRDLDSLLGLVKRAGDGDTVLVEQLCEHAHWGTTAGTPYTDPNPRLEAYIDAARRGATVRILLNGSRDAGSVAENNSTRDYVNGVAGSEGLNIRADLGDPAGRGIHNKMVLVWLNGEGGYAHVGSVNGTEASNKRNREMALQMRSDDVYRYLARVFEVDWWLAHATFLPLLTRAYAPPAPPVDHAVISEVYYAAASPSLEWVEVCNPTDQPIDLSSHRIGDAQTADQFEGMYLFPLSTTIPAQSVLVVAFDGSQVAQADFEMVDRSDTPDMIKSAAWGTGDWTLRNDGDQVLLLGPADQVVDVVVWGDAVYPGVSPHPGVSVFTHALERYPYYYDTDDCAFDFRDCYPPTPGSLPK